MLVSQVRYNFPTLESSAAPLRWVFGNWNASGIFQAQSGAPFSVTTTVDVAGVGPGSGPQFYEQVGDPMAVRTDWDSTLARATWFDRAAFRIPTTGTYATSQEKNSLQQPGFWDINMSLRKGFVFGAQRFDLRLEAFNILNRTRLGNAVTNPTLPDFGFITSRVGNRSHRARRLDRQRRVLGLAAFVQHGFSLLWVVLIAIAFQTIFNTEVMRYTLATGEPVFSAFMCTRPSSTLWAWVYVALYFLAGRLAGVGRHGGGGDLVSLRAAACRRG